MGDQPFQSLYRRYRPQRFSDVRGQEHVTIALRNAVRTNRVAHAYLFSGPRGTGKTSTARILAAALNCANPVDGEPDGVCESCTAIRTGSSLDVLELDAASNNGVDAMRDLVTRAALGSPGRWKVYIVDEVHMLTTAASNALLKTLEEPPGHVIFVLATTDDQKVLATIKSRTQHYHFRLLGPEVLGSLLADVNDAADLGLGPETLDRVLRRGNGSARDALSALDQAAAAGTAEDEADVVPDIVEALIAKDAGAGLMAVAEAARRGRDPHRLAIEVIEHLRGAFLCVMAPDVSDVPASARATAEDRARRLGTPATVRAMEVLGETLVDMRESLDTRVTLEVALVRLCAPAADTSPAALLERLDSLERRVAAGVAGSEQTRLPGSEQTRPPAPEHRSPAVVDAEPPRVASPSRQPSSAQAARGSAGESGRSPGGSDRPGGDGVPSRGAPPGPPALASTDRSGSPRPTIGAMRRRPAGPGADPEPSGEGSDLQAQPPTAGALLDRDELTKVWGDVLFPTMSPGVKSVFREGHWSDAGEGMAVFVVSSAMFLPRAEEKRPEVEEALSRHFGGRVVVRLESASGAPPAGGSASRRPEPQGAPSGRPAGRAPAPQVPPTYDGPPPSDPPGGFDDEPVSAAEFADLEAAPDAPASAAARLMDAFPGTEELPG